MQGESQVVFPCCCMTLVRGKQPANFSDHNPALNIAAPSRAANRTDLVFPRGSVWTCGRGMDNNPLSGEQFDSLGRAWIRWVTSALEEPSQVVRNESQVRHYTRLREESPPNLPRDSKSKATTVTKHGHGFFTSSFKPRKTHQTHRCLVRNVSPTNTQEQHIHACANLQETKPHSTQKHNTP